MCLYSITNLRTSYIYITYIIITNNDITYYLNVIIYLPNCVGKLYYYLRYQLPSVRIDVCNSPEWNHLIEGNKNLF